MLRLRIENILGNIMGFIGRKRIDALADVTKLAGFEFTKYMKYIPDGDIIAVRALNLKNGSLLLDDVKRISSEVSNLLPRSKLFKNDIVISYTGTIGESAQIKEDGKYHLAPNVAKISPNETIDPQYLFHYVRSSEFRKQMTNYAHGSTQPTVPMATIRELTVPIFDIETQKKISGLLNVIEDKIETNRNVNDNLHQQLQAIYRKMVCQGTPNGKLSDICNYSKRRIPVSSLTIDNYYSTENLLTGKAGAVRVSSLPSISHTVACMPGDVLVSNIRPYFKKILYCLTECGCSNDVLCFVPIKPNLSLYLYNTLYDDKFFDFMVAGSKGTKMPRGDKQQIMTYPVLIPTPTMLESFNNVARPIQSKIDEGNRQNRCLSSLRDFLLPKLMSGEISVSDANL